MRVLRTCLWTLCIFICVDAQFSPSIGPNEVLVYGFGFVTGVAAERARTSRGSQTSEGDDDDDEDEDDEVDWCEEIDCGNKRCALVENENGEKEGKCLPIDPCLTLNCGDGTCATVTNTTTEEPEGKCIQPDPCLVTNCGDGTCAMVTNIATGQLEAKCIEPDPCLTTDCGDGTCATVTNEGTGQLESRCIPTDPCSTMNCGDGMCAAVTNAATGELEAKCIPSDPCLNVNCGDGTCATVTNAANGQLEAECLESDPCLSMNCENGRCVTTANTATGKMEGNAFVMLDSVVTTVSLCQPISTATTGDVCTDMCSVPGSVCNPVTKQCVCDCGYDYIHETVPGRTVSENTRVCARGCPNGFSNNYWVLDNAEIRNPVMSTVPRDAGTTIGDCMTECDNNSMCRSTTMFITGGGPVLCRLHNVRRGDPVDFRNVYADQSVQYAERTCNP